MSAPAEGARPRSSGRRMSAAVSGTYSRPAGQGRRLALGGSRTSRASSHAGRSARSQMGDVTDGIDDDLRIDWFKATVCSVLSVSPETFQHLLDQRESRQAISAFFDTAACRLVNFHLEEPPDEGDMAGIAVNGKIKCTNELPEQSMCEIGCVVYLKNSAHRLSHHDPAADVIMIELRDGVLGHLSNVSRHALFPLLNMPQNRKGLTNAAFADFSYSTEEFVCGVEIMSGKMQGEVVLPVPTSIEINDVKKLANTRNSIRMLEFNVLAWTKQIRWSVIKEPEDLARNQLQYWPCKELDFWASRSMELDAILMQLGSPKSCNVIQALRLSKSTYCEPLNRAVKEVTNAGLEARSNTTYLETLRASLEKMEDMSQPFEKLESTSEAETSAMEQAEQEQKRNSVPQAWPDLLKNTMHLLYLISKHSPYYNTSNRILFFVRLVENLTVHRARAFVYNGRGNEVFVDFSEETSRRLEIAIHECSSLKDLYLKYETRYEKFQKIGHDAKENAWARPLTGYFVRLEQFIERCQDVLLLARSACTFEVLGHIEFGGANGHKTTARARSLYQDMRSLFQQMTQVEYSLLLVEETTQFGHDFNCFCSSLKALELRGLSFLQLAYEECHNLASMSDLILSLAKVAQVDTFRPLLAKMLARALGFYRAQVEATRDVFISQQATKSRTIADNLPEVASKLFWVKALMDRLAALDRKLRSLASLLPPTDLESFQEALSDGAKMRIAMRNFENVTYLAWVKKVQQLPDQVLNQPLILCSPQQQHGEQPVVETIQINFPPSVLEHFREAKYTKQLGYQLPETAHYLFDRSEKIRAYLAHLKLIVDQFNELFGMSSEPEWPLLQPSLDLVLQNVQDAAGPITWKSNRVDDFIVKIKCELKGCRATWDKLKENHAGVLRILDEWGQRPLFRRNKTQSYSLSAFDNFHSTNVQARYKVIHNSALHLQSLLEDSMIVSANNWTSPHWAEYASYMRKLCADWLTAFVRQNLVHLADEVTCVLPPAEFTRKVEENDDDMTNDMALLDITIELLHGAVAEFVPSMTAVKTSVFQWRDSIMKAVAHATHDSLDVNYMPQIDDDELITSLKEKVSNCVDKTTRACAAYRDLYFDYHFLWLEGGEDHFQQTVRSKILTENNDMPNMQVVSNIVLHLLQLRDRLATFNDFQRIAWIRVDARPLKSAIATLLSARLDRHIVFLQDLLAKHLDSVVAFLTSTAQQLTKANDMRTGNEYMLVLVLRAVQSIKQERENLESTMQALEHIANFLRGHGYVINASREKQLSNTFQEWTDLQKFALHVKDKYSVLIAAEFDRLRRRVNNLQEECQTAKTQISMSKIWSSDQTDEMSYELIQAQHEQICALKRDQTEVYELESLLEASKPMPDSMPVIIQCFLQILGAKKLWDLHGLVNHNLDAWNSKRWSDVRVDELLTATREFMSMLTEVPQSPDQNVQHMLEFYVCNSELYRSIEESLQFVLDSLPIAEQLQDSAVRPRHINKLMSISGHSFALDENMTLEDILSQRLPNFMDDIQTLVALAEKEMAIEEAIESLQDRWALQKVVTAKHTDVEEVVLAAEMADVASNIQAFETELTLLLRKRFGEVFREQGFQLQETFEQAVEFIESMLAAQSLWLTLFGLIQYDSTGLLDMLPGFKQAFASADASLRRVLSKVVSYDTVKEMMPLISDTRTRQVHFTVSKTPQDILDDLEGCKKLLSTWLDQRRSFYPRFYLLSDEELIKVLSQGMQSPRRLGKCLPRILHGVHALEFATAVHSTGNEVTAVSSKLGEHLSLGGQIKFRVRETSLETWFQELEARISQALKVGVMDGVRKMSTNRLAHWAVEQCLQIVLLSFRVQWTGLVERALDVVDYGESLKALQELEASNLDNVAKVAQYLRNMRLDPLKRTKYSIIAAYESWGVDSIRYLSKSKKEQGSSNHIDSARLFEWQIQVRYYLRHAETEEDSSCRMRIGDSSLDYGFELLGLKEPFCFGITSTKSFLGFAMVMQHRLLPFLGSSLSATPCMGKTETFKQFAIASGQQYHIFTCTPHVARKAITASVLGMSQSGSLGLWENFDKVPSGVMCLAAGLMKAVTNALRGGREADVDGLNVIPKNHFGLFLSFAYGASRTVELPHDLRVLVRPVSVIAPDFNALAQLLLMSQGFAGYADLATKLCAHLFLCKTMLSSKELTQDPWWSLTSIRTIVKKAGSRKTCTPDVSRNPSSATSSVADVSFSRVSSATSKLEQHQDLGPDITLLVKQILDFNRTVILPGQEQTLKLITSTVFGKDQAANTSAPAPIPSDVPLPKHDRESLLHSICEKGLQPGPNFVAKLEQLREILSVRFSTYIVGAAGVGKSEVWRSLAAAEQQEKKLVVHTINPNALELRHLCGSYDECTMEWRDGALCHMIRNSEHLSYEHSPSMVTWIVLDGEVQAEWLELLSPSFDGPHQLALDSGEVLQFDDDTRVLMETLSLKHAIPSAAARSGVLYISDKVVSMDDVVSSWLANLQRDSVRVEVEHQLAKKLPLLIKFINDSSSMEFVAPTSCRACCLSMIRILDGLISAENNDWAPETRAQKCLWMFDFAAVWGFGGTIAVDKVLDGRRIFSDWWRQQIGSLGGRDLPVLGTVFDYTYHPSTFEMCAWKDLVSSTKYFARSARDDIIVSTPLSVSINRLLEATTYAGHGLLVVGAHGVGKTSIVQEFMRGLPINYLYRRIGLQLHSTAAHVQQDVKLHLRKKAGHVYGPTGDKTLLIFVDDLAQPQSNAGRARSSAALIHQHIEHAIWYDVEHLHPCHVRNLQYVAAMIPSRGPDGVDARLMNKFSIITAPEPDGHAIACTVTSILTSFMQNFEPSVKEAGQTLGPLVSDVHSRLAQHFASPQYPAHFQFSLNNVRNVLNSVCRVNPELYASPVVFVSLLVYELHREYCDRMDKKEDVHIFKSILKDGINKHLELGMADDPQLFGIAHVADFDSGTVAPSRTSGIQWRELVAERLEQHNESNPPMEMVIWDQVVEQVVRLARVFKHPKRSLILLGHGGTGRQSLVRLASHCCQVHFIHYLTPYAHNELASMKHELVSALKMAGLSGQAVCFFLKDAAASNSRFLTFVNQILQGDLVLESKRGDNDDRALFSLQQQSKILEQIKEADQSIQQSENTVEDGNLWQGFMERALANLHFVFCLDLHVGLGRLNDFPIFVQKCCINIIPQISNQDRIEIATQKLRGLRFDENERSNERIHYSVLHTICSIYSTADQVGREYSHHCNRQYALGISQHVDLINVFMSIMSSFSTLLEERVALLTKCENRLAELRIKAEQLIDDRTKYASEIEEANRVVEELTIILGKKSTEMEDINENLQKAQTEHAKRHGEYNRLQSLVAEARMSVVPNYKGAASDLKLLDRVLLGEVKAYSTPPPAMERVLSIAIILSTPPGKSGTWDVSWPRAKRTISHADRFVMDLLAVDPEHVTPERIAAIKPYFDDYQNFTPLIHDLSEVLAIVWDWSVCVWEYITTYYETIVSLESEKEQAHEALERATEHLVKMQEEQTTMEKELAALSHRFERASSHKSTLQAKAKGGMERHENAKSLIARLETDDPFWKQERAELVEKQKTVVGDSLLGALLVVYCGPFSQQYRNILLSKCRTRMMDVQVHFSSTHKTGHVFLRPGEEYEWYSRGLPSLNFGTRNAQACENYIITHKTLRCPLWLDPDGIALRWCKELSVRNTDDRQVMLVTSGDGFVERLKACVENGAAAVCNVLPHHSDTLLESLLQMRVVKKGKLRYVNIGGDPVQVGKGFRLMLRTTCDTLPFSPEVTSKCTMINFSMDPQDFEDCVLTMATSVHVPHMLQERPALLNELINVTLKVAQDKDAVIEVLMNMSDNLADTEEVEKISKFKKLVDANREKLQIAENKMAGLRDASIRYESFARWLASASVTVQDAWRLDASYIFSAQEIIHVLEMYLVEGGARAVRTQTRWRQTGDLEPESDQICEDLQKETAQEDEAKVQQIRHLAEQCIARLHLRTSHTLAQQHRLPFLVHNYFQAQIAFGSVNRELYSDLVNRSLSRAHKIELLRTRVDTFRTLIPDLSIPVGADTTTGFASDPDNTSVDDQWRSWMDCEKPEETPLPFDVKYGQKEGAIQLDDVHKMLLLLALRPDRVGLAVTKALIDLGSMMSGTPHAGESIDGLEEALRLQHSMNGTTYVPGRVCYPCPVPIVLYGAQEMEMCNEVLRLAGDTGLLKPSQGIHILSASNPSLDQTLCESACNDSWVFIRDVPLCVDACDLVNRWLQNLALASKSVDSEDQLESRLDRRIQSTFSVSGRHALKKPHDKFRLFIAIESITTSLHVSFASLWNKCVALNCTHAATGILANYSRLSRTVLRGRSEDAKIDHLTHILRRTLLMHLIWNRFSVGGCGWRFPYKFDAEDILFGKDRIVELLIAHQSSLSRFEDKQLVSNFQSCSYILSELVHGGRIDDLWDLCLARDVARKLFLLDGQSMTEDASELIKAPNQITLEERLRSFYMVHDPDQAESAGEIASMFESDLSSLQEVLHKKYGARLGFSQASSTDFAQSSGNEVQSLIDTIEATVLAVGPENTIGDSFQLHLSTLGTMVMSDACSTPSKPAGGTADVLLELSPAVDAPHAVPTAFPGALEFGEGMLDEIREKTEAIARALPWQQIPLDALLYAIRNEGKHDHDLEVDSEAVDVSLLHAVLTECNVLNKLMDTVHATLDQIDMALQRNSLLGGNKHQALALAKGLVAGQVPWQWSKDSYPTTKPLAHWLRELADIRIPQAMSWATKGVGWMSMGGSQNCCNLGSLCCPQVFVGAFIMSCLEARVSNRQTRPKTSSSIDQQIHNASSDASQPEASPAHVFKTGELDIVNVGAPSLILDASIIDMPLHQPLQTLDEHPYWIVSGLYMQGASWVRANNAEGQPSVSPRPKAVAAVHFAQKPVTLPLPAVALRVASRIPDQELHGLVPVYQSRRKDTSPVVALHFDVADGESTWTSTACIFLEEILE